MRILLVGESANHRDRLAGYLRFAPDFAAVPAPQPDDPAFAAAVNGADVVVALRFPRLVAPAPALRLLHVPGAGLDGIDMASVPPGAFVCNVFEHEIPIAEFVCLALLHHATGFDALRAGFTPESWTATYRARVPHRELHGQTLGLLGFGRIGREIARRARAFGLRVVAVDPHAGADAAPADAVLPPARLHEMLRQADFVVVACPLMDATRNAIGAAELDAMKPTAVLVNVSRAEVVAEQPLYEALRDRRIAAAYLDVWYRYPSGTDGMVAPSTLPFHALPNAICTPHSSAWTEDLFARRYAVIARNITRVRDGLAPENVVRAPLGAATKGP